MINIDCRDWFDEIAGRVDEILQRQSRAVIAIDGRCASGKTTAAHRLAERFGGEIIRMDDFFLPPELRSDERYAEAGGNVHYERFKEEVVKPLVSNEQFTYRVFDCHKGDYSGERCIKAAPLIIIEGAYSLHPKIGAVYDMRVFMSVSPAEQRRRIAERNGAKALLSFEQKWIPLEERYFDTFSVRDSCDIIAQTDISLNPDIILDNLSGGEIGKNLILRDSVSSTNTLLREQARAGAPHGTVFAAARQSGGRGRMGRTFLSPDGGVYLSLLLRNGLDAKDNAILTSVAAVAFCKALQGFTAERIGIKWVNDLLINGQKLAGILAEGVFSPEGRMDGVIIGIGVNIGSVPDDVSDIACALPQKDKFIRERVIAALICSLEDTLHRPFNEVIDDYRTMSAVIGHQITILSPHGEISAMATGIDNAAHLLCRSEDGTEYCLDSGEIRIRIG